MDQEIALKITTDASQTEKSVKSIKTELREAQQDAINLSRKFGDTSTEALQAAQRVANLRDEVADFKQRVDALNPDAKFRAFSQSLQGVAGGFAGLQGAIGLFGTESKDLEKQLLKVQSALALSEGLNAIFESKEAFKNLKIVALDAFKSIKAAIGSTGIGLFVVALGTIVAYWDEIKAAVGGVSEEQKKLAEQSTARFKTEQDNLKAINEQDNTLKLQGLSEKEILALKKKQTEEAITAGEINIKTQSTNIQLAVEAEKRNKKLLEGYLQFVLIIPRTLFKYSSQAINGVVELLNKIPGVNIDFKINDKLLDDGIGSLTKMIFDPEQVANNGKATLKEASNVLTQLKNQRDGYILESRKTDKDGKSVGLIDPETDPELQEVLQRGALRNSIQQTLDTKLLENRTAVQDKILSISKKTLEEEVADALSAAEAKAEINNAYLDTVGQFGNLISALAGKNKTLAIAGVVIEQASAIGRIISNTAVANAKAVAASPLTGGMPFVAINKVSAGLGIASSIAAGSKAISQIKSAPGGTSSGGGGLSGGASIPGGANPAQAPIAPAIQVTQASLMQGGNNVNVQNTNAVKAFVVERDITDSQDRINKIKAAATI